MMLCVQQHGSLKLFALGPVKVGNTDGKKWISRQDLCARLYVCTKVTISPNLALCVMVSDSGRELHT